MNIVGTQSKVSLRDSRETTDNARNTQRIIAINVKNLASNISKIFCVDSFYFVCQLRVSVTEEEVESV